ncbi:hypothetical protein [Actinomadura rugatobispora]|uniref:Aminoglycoside phosphotransferase domain-containing protein n=1 Tax=Actinomadura rugatobispora TaxID=1994 RepID=A0ABW0ZQK6_9ACTN|nr:hypothetical protein GCM10010200_034970 [Actinomadura rugatobispora]
MTGAERVRDIRGPIADRLCLRTRSGFQWVERLHRPGPHYLGRAQLSLLREAFPGAHVPWAYSAAVAVWPAVPSPALLSDRMLTSAFAEDDPDWPRTLRALGALAARVHRTPLTDELRAALPDRSGGPAWLAEEAVAAEVRAHRALLPLETAPELAAAAARPPASGPATLVHGRLSAGSCADGPVPLAWREAGIGDPQRDLAHLLAEIVEAAALVNCPAPVARARVEAFLDGYRDLAPAGLPPLWDAVARRIVEHYAQGVWAGGDLAGAAAALPSVERCWAELRPAGVAHR